MACMYGKCRTAVRYRVRNQRGGTVAELCADHFNGTWCAAPHPGLHVNFLNGDRAWPVAVDETGEELDSKESEGGLQNGTTHTSPASSFWAAIGPTRGYRRL